MPTHTSPSKLLNWLFVSTAMLFVASGATAKPAENQYDLCARVESKDIDNPVLQTLHINLTLNGPEIAPDVRKQAQAELIAKVLQRENPALSVFVEKYDQLDCAASGDLVTSIVAGMTPDEVAMINTNATRGGATLFSGLQHILSDAKSDNNAATASSDKATGLWLKIHYASNRAVTQDSGGKTVLGNQAGDPGKLSFGQVLVGVKRQKNMKNLETPSIVKFDGVTKLDEFSVAGEYTPQQPAVWRKDIKIAAERLGQAGVLLFIHGFNNDFNQAAVIAGQLAYDLAFPGAVVVFSWPSTGSVMDYASDERQAALSGAALASLLQELTILRKEGAVLVVAHSMGNRVLLDGLTRMVNDGKSRAPTLVVMAAPDVPTKDFRQTWGQKLNDATIPLTLYASSNDKAIKISETVHQDQRLGNATALFGMWGMDSIDASAVTREWPAMQHAYFRENDTVLGDLFGLIRFQKAAALRPRLRKIDGSLSSWVLQGNP